MAVPEGLHVIAELPKKKKGATIPMSRYACAPINAAALVACRGAQHRRHRCSPCARELRIPSARIV